MFGKISMFLCFSNIKFIHVQLKCPVPEYAQLNINNFKKNSLCPFLLKSTYSYKNTYEKSVYRVL